MDWGSFLGGFMGGTASALVVEILRRLARREQYARVIYEERLKAYRQIHMALNTLLTAGDISPLKTAYRLVFLFSGGVVGAINDVFDAHAASGDLDGAITRATKALREDLSIPEIEWLFKGIFSGRFWR